MKAALVLVLFWHLGASALMAQITGSSVSGVVIDASGASVPAARVELRNLATEIVQVLTTNAEGLYVAANLPPGPYKVTVAAAGFETQITSLLLTTGGQAQLNFTVQVGSERQTVEVQAPPEGIELGTSAIGAVVHQQTIEDLPLNGRSWTDLATLEPGVAQVESQYSYTASNSRGNRGFGSQLSVSGGRPQQNSYLLDGININDYANGGPGSVVGGNLGVDAVREFSILTGSYPASDGRASAAIISAITRSGTNAFHGSLYEFLRNSRLDARNFFDSGSPPPFRRNQFGASAGGPVIRNRTFLFANYEGLRQATGITNLVTVPSAAARQGTLSTGSVVVDPAVQRFLSFYPLPNSGLLGKGDTGLFRFVGQQTADGDFFTLRGDHYISERDRLSASYRFDNLNFTAPDTLNTELIGSATRNQMASLSEDHTFTSTLMNSFRAGMSRTVAENFQSIRAIIPESTDVSLGALPGRTAPNVSVPGLTNFTGGLGGPGAYLFHYTSIQLYDDLSLTRGLHSLKIGFALERIRSNILALSNPDGQFTFGSLPGFLTNQPLSFNVGLAQTLTPRGLRQTIAGAYFQDDWRVRPGLSLNAGLRYEMSTVPTEVQGKLSVLRALSDPQPHLGNPYFANPTLRNFEARTGFAWDPFGDGRTAVRSGFGIYDVLPLPYEFELLSSLAAPFFRVGSTNSLPAGAFPAGAVQYLGPSSNAQSYIEPRPHRNYVLQWNLNVQRSLPGDFTVMAAYVGSSGVHQPFRTEDANTVLPMSTPAGYVWPSPAGSGTVINPDNGQIRALFWQGKSSYHALEFRLARDVSRSLQVQGSFTWSKSIDTGSGTVTGTAYTNSIGGLPWYNLNIIRGVSDFNIPRVAVFQAIWTVPSFLKTGARFLRAAAAGWQLSSIVKLADGIPFTPLIAGDPLGQKSASTFDFPDRLEIPGCGSAVNPGHPAGYIRTACFSFPSPVTALGNSGRNILAGPGQATVDVSLVRSFVLRAISDRFKAQFRTDFFNLLNRANFLPPLNNLRVFDATGRPVASAGLLDNTATPSRQIQFALKLVW